MNTHYMRFGDTEKRYQTCRYRDKAERKKKMAPMLVGAGAHNEIDMIFKCLL